MDFCPRLAGFWSVALFDAFFGIKTKLALWGKVRCVPSNSFVEFVRGCYKFCERLVEFMSEGILDLESSQWAFLELGQYPSYKFLGVFLFK